MRGYSGKGRKFVSCTKKSLRNAYVIQLWPAPALTLVDASAGKASWVALPCLWYGKRKTVQELWAYCWVSNTALQTEYMELCLKLNYCSLGKARALLPWLSRLWGRLSPASQSTLQLATSALSPSGGPKCHFCSVLAEVSKGSGMERDFEDAEHRAGLWWKAPGPGQGGAAVVPWFNNSVWRRRLINGWKLDVPKQTGKDSGETEGWGSKTADWKNALWHQSQPPFPTVD